MTGSRRRSRSRTPPDSRVEGYTSRHPKYYPKPDSTSRDDKTQRSFSPSRRRHQSPESSRHPSERGRGRHSTALSVSRSRSRSRSPKRSKQHKKRRDRSSSRSTSGDGKESKSEHKRKHRHKHRDRSRSPKRHKKPKKEKTVAVTSQWGKYGVINESDIYNKEEEFKTWLVEECKINPETLSKDQTKKYFARYMEDYNTATLPHEKFYNMKHYESRMNLLRNGELVPQGDEDTYDFDADYRAHTSALKNSSSNQTQSYLTKEKLQELRQVERERVELIKRKQLGLEVSVNLGVRMDGHNVDEPLDM